MVALKNFHREERKGREDFEGGFLGVPRVFGGSQV
jgi:hypothetical protein